MSYSDPEHFQVDVGYRDPLDEREDVPTDRSEDEEYERRQQPRRLGWDVPQGHGRPAVGEDPDAG